ncbi:M14 family metallopeptidase [Pseudomonas japonica]|uniref:M14 family metallopeptidase n=1 Tax=Pseudomonas japonica TaxID=256466 RepID=UPI0015E3CA00|nr:carboxypeptidase family protein [Pseudomonas japonica]MBA1243485.1 carboxypeptidase family protein [Pseudomonas japonica]MBA1290465.1 carboxypeptidase family protein [Pseudomonas japonica]
MHVNAPLVDISADFDTGNIQLLDGSDPSNIRLAILPDSCSAHFQWFHFRAEGLEVGRRHGFVITNAGQSSYPSAWQGYNAAASYDGVQWFRVPTEYDGQALRFNVTAEATGISFAYFEPYREARHFALIERARNLPGVQEIACGKSLEGRDIPLFRAGDGTAGKRKVWLIAQQHPGEHMAEWFMEGVIEALEQHQQWMQALLQQAELYLVLNMNPDGAFHGHLRTNAAGKDLNRAWQDSTPAETPEVHFVREHMALHGVDLFIDAHGDEEIPHVFTAACEGNPGYTPRLAALETAFRDALCQQTPDFQQVHGYTRDAPGQANMRLACNAVGQRFDCLAMTLEMPFKDHLDAPEPRAEWSGARSARLAQDLLKVVAGLVPRLR